MDYLGWVNGWTEGQTSRQTLRMDEWMDRYAVHSKFVLVHCTVVCEKCTVRLRLFMAVSMTITIVGICHRLNRTYCSEYGACTFERLTEDCQNARCQIPDDTVLFHSP
jgi:hypothetical protein